MKYLLPGLVLSCAAVASTPALADTFDYTFTSGISASDHFTYDSPALITTATSFTPLTCDSCTGAYLDPGANGTVQIFFGLNSDQYDGLPASFFTVGDNFAFGGALELDIVDVPPVASTPEPSSLLLLGTGAVCLFGITRLKGFGNTALRG